MKKPNGYWTKERVAETAATHETRTKFQQGDRSPYYIAWRNGWLDDVCAHMSSPIKRPGFWNKARCHEEALKYNSRSDFRGGSSKAYFAALRKGFMDAICHHMDRKINLAGY